jgi:hypothetical protein
MIARLSPHVGLGGKRKPGSSSINPIHKVTLNGFQSGTCLQTGTAPRSLRFGEALGIDIKNISTDGSTIKILERRVITCSKDRRLWWEHLLSDDR